MVDYFVDKSKFEQQFRLLFAYATLAHVEQGRIVKLTNGRAMRTFHIVGVDFEHGLGVHVRLFRGTDVLVTHLRIGVLGILSHQHQASERTNGLIVQHIFI